MFCGWGRVGFVFFLTGMMKETSAPAAAAVLPSDEVVAQWRNLGGVGPYSARTCSKRIEGWWRRHCWRDFILIGIQLGRERPAMLVTQTVRLFGGVEKARVRKRV